MDGNLDFTGWVACVSVGGLVSRPREKAVEEWQQSRARQRGERSGSPQLPEAGEPNDDADRASKNFRLLAVVTLSGALGTLALWRLGFGDQAAFALLALILVTSGFAGAVDVGGWRKIAWWFGGATLAAFGIALLFRYVDKGVVW